MSLRRITLVAGLLAAWTAGAARAQGTVPDTAAAPPPSDPYPQLPAAASPSVTNPAISVIGWFQAVAGNDSTAQEQSFELREAELAFQAAVDPFTRADFFLSAGPEGLDVEEGYLTWLALPGGGQAKLGKFRADLGKFNRTHPPETPFADRPLAAAAFLGDEGLALTGIAASALIPNPLDLYWDVIANVGAIPGPGETPLFEAGSRSDLLVLGRSSLFVPLRESGDLNLGVSYANARANTALRESEGDRAQVGVIDLTYRWKNPRRSIYRSLLIQGEVLRERGSAEVAARRTGGYVYAVYQFARQWKAGVRADRAQHPEGGWESGALALLQYQPSEFSTLSLQLRRRHDDATDRDHDAAFFKWTFNIGPHGAHPY